MASTLVQGLRMDITGPGARASPVYSVPRGDLRTAPDLSPNIRTRGESSADDTERLCKSAGRLPLCVGRS